MQWSKPEFEAVSLAMEVTAYVNTDDSLPTLGARIPAIESSEHSIEREAESVSAG